MLLKQYENDGKLLNISFVEAASDAQCHGFRGRLALAEGEIADSAGNRKPPHIVMEHVVLLEKDGKLVLSAGSLDRLENLKDFVDMYKEDFAPEMLAIMYVVNLTQPLLTEMAGITFSLIPMQEGITWNELLDEAGLDKRELKNKSGADKVLAVWEELKGFRGKGSLVTLEEALTRTADIKRIERGAL